MTYILSFVLPSMCSWNFYVFSCSPKQRKPSGLIGSVTLESFPNHNILYSRKSWKVIGFIKKHLCCSAGFHWHKVNFLHSSCCLCFAFVSQRIFIILTCFHFCWSRLTGSRGLFCLSLHPKEGCGGTRNWEGTKLGQPTPAGPWDFPFHMVWCSAYKTEE